MRYIIRPATKEDFPALCDAHGASIRELGPQAYGPEIMASWGKTLKTEQYEVAMNEQGEVFFVAKPNAISDEVLGFSSYRFHDEKHWLQGIYVRGTAARQGIGAALYAEVEKRALEKNAKELYVEGSLVGEPFYRAMGFEVIERKIHTLQNSAEMKCLIMGKVLAS